MQTVIVTGSDGFIGSHIVQELLDHNYFIIGIDNHSKYKVPCKDHHRHPNFKISNYDLRYNYQILNWLFEDYSNSIVIHCAASIGGIHYFHENVGDIIVDNALIDANIIRLSSKNKVKRFIALSSSMVYENAHLFPTPESHTYNIPPPKSTYGFSKLCMEYMIKGAHDQYDLEYTIIRAFNAIGIGENDFLEGKTSHVVPDLIIKCLRDNFAIDILGDGNQIRHYTAAKDIARGIRLAMESQAAKNEIFNISTSVSTTVLQLARKIWNKINPDKEFRYLSQTPYEYDVQKRIPCTKKAKKLLGFEAEISLDQSLDEIINYIKDKLVNV